MTLESVQPLETLEARSQEYQRLQDLRTRVLKTWELVDVLHDFLQWNEQSAGATQAALIRDLLDEIAADLEPDPDIEMLKYQMAQGQS